MNTFRLLSSSVPSRPRSGLRSAMVQMLCLLVAGLCAVAALPPTVQAQTPTSTDLSTAASATASGADTMQISFNEAVRIALDQNTDLRRAANQVRSADATIAAERMDFFPTASISSGGQRSFGRSFSQEEGGLVNQTTDFLTIDGSANLTLFDGFSNFASLDRAKAQGEASEFSLDRTRQDVVFQVMNRYLTLVESREVLRVQREELQARQQQLAQIREFVDAGSRPVSALYEQEAAVAEQKSSVLSAERDVELAETRLLQVLQLDPMQPYRFEAPALGDDSVRTESYDLNQLLDQAMSRRTDLRAARADMRAAGEGVTVAKSGYYPTISLGFNYGSDWSSTAPDVQRVPTGFDTVNLLTQEGVTIPEQIPTGFETSQFDFFDKLNQRRGGSVSIRLSYSLFDGLRRNERVEQAQVRAQNAEYDLEDQRLQVALEVREAYLNHRNAVQQLEAATSRLRSARQAREAAQERYNLGAASIVELTNANRNFVEAASQRIRARYNLVFQKKLIDYYVGVLNPQEALFR